MTAPITLMLPDQPQNQVFASPDGASGPAGMRALTVNDLPASGLAAGVYTNATVTVDEHGRITGIASGSSSGGSGPSAGRLVGYASYSTVGTYTFNWPDGVDFAIVDNHGAGASGGGSQWVQLAGAGGSGAFLRCKVPRPASGQSTVVIGAGGASIPANTLAQGNPGGTTSFGPNCSTSGTGGGQHAAGANVGGDGGTPGIASSSDYIFWIPGGMGTASAPVGSDGLNHSHPQGANAPMGGCGGNNGQNGMQPGGGGAPGNRDFASGHGGDGQIEIYLYSA